MGPGSTNYDQIEIMTIRHIANAVDSGNETGNTQDWGKAAQSDGNRATYCGTNHPAPNNIIRYVTIGSLGDGVDFGDQTAAKDWRGPAAGA